MTLRRIDHLFVGLVLAVATGGFLVYVLITPHSVPAKLTGDAPTARDDVATLPKQGAPVRVDVASNDFDPNGDLDPLSVAIIDGPRWGMARVDIDGTIEYSPTASWPGEDTIEYEICDSSRDCASASLTIKDRPIVSSGAETRFVIFGDYGDNSNGEAAVARLVADLDPDFIVTTGDNSYDVSDFETNVGQFYSDYIGSYSGTYGTGALINRFFPALGDHDYSDAGLEAYLDYFTLPGAGVVSTRTSANERYYDVVIGPVHLFILNLQAEEPDGLDVSSVQAGWLRDQLSASTSPWRLVVAPVSPYSSGDRHGSDTEVQWPYGQWGADAVFSGNDHVYERILLDGLPYFVTGLGGRSMYGFDTPIEGSLFRYAADFGVVLVDACDSGIHFEFQTVSQGVVDELTLGDEPCPSAQDTFGS